EHFLAERSERRNIVTKPAISAITARTATAVSTGSSVSSPDPRDIVPIVRLVGVLRISRRNPALSALPYKRSRQCKLATKKDGCLNPIGLHGRPAPLSAPPRGASPGPPPATPISTSPFSLRSLRMAPTGVPAREGASVMVTLVPKGSAASE